MNNFPSTETVKMLKDAYPVGTRIYLENMNDSLAPVPAGTKGTVRHVDDMGTIHVQWDNGRSLGLVPGEDSFRKLRGQELDEEQKEVRYEYTLHIHRYGRYLQFDSLGDLKDEVKRYFTPKELKSGIVDRLTSFSKKNDDGFYRNTYQDFEICCYEHELDISDNKTSLDSKIQNASERAQEPAASSEAKTREPER